MPDTESSILTQAQRNAVQRVAQNHAKERDHVLGIVPHGRFRLAIGLQHGGLG